MSKAGERIESLSSQLSKGSDVNRENLEQYHLLLLYFYFISFHYFSSIELFPLIFFLA